MFEMVIIPAKVNSESAQAAQKVQHGFEFRSIPIFILRSPSIVFMEVFSMG